MDNTSEKVMKRTTTQQFEKLVSVMEKNPDVAKGMGNFGSTKQSRHEFWDGVAIDLNSIGPPFQSGPEWNKVWLDRKLKLKKKIACTRRETVATGGGPYTQRSLTPLERTVDDLLHLQQAVNPTGLVFGVPDLNTEACSNESALLDDKQHKPTPSNLNATVATSSNKDVTTTPSRRRQNVDQRENIRIKTLEKQTELQESLLETMKSLDRNLADIARYTRKTYELKKEELELLKRKEDRMQREGIEATKRHNEKIEIKLKELELKKLKYNKQSN